MRSLKEKVCKQASNDAFKIYNIYRRFVWLGGNSCHSAIQMCVNLTFSKRYISFNFLYSPLIFAVFTKCNNLFQFFCFSFAKLTIQISIICDNAAIRDCRRKQRSANRLTALSFTKCASKSHQTTCLFPKSVLNQFDIRCRWQRGTWYFSGHHTVKALLASTLVSNQL